VHSGLVWFGGRLAVIWIACEDSVASNYFVLV
jgi:hypothetical protein